MKRYLKTIIIVLFIMIGLLLLEKTIPNSKSIENINKSTNYYKEYYKNESSKINNIKYKHYSIDMLGELSELSMIYLENNKNYYSEMIEMNFDYYAPKKISTSYSPTDFQVTNDYSRYWHGNLIFLKPLTSLFKMSTVYKIHLVILSLLFCILLFKLLQHSKLLAIAFFASALSINIFLVTKSTLLINVFYLAFISSLITIKMYEKKSKNIDLLFLIIGMLTAYFDLLSCETITLTLPLFIYLFLHLKDEKKLDIKLIIKVIVLWLIGFIISYLAKWLLLVIHYHGHFKDKVINPMTIRVYKDDTNIFESFILSIKNSFHYFIPFAHIKLKHIFVIVSTIICFINLILEKKNRITYLFLILICITPLARYFVLSSHSADHNYFTYRAFIPIIMLLITSDILLLTKLKKIKKSS